MILTVHILEEKTFLKEMIYYLKHFTSIFTRVIATDNNTYVDYWQSNRVSNEKLNAPNTNTNNHQAPILKYNGSTISLQFSGDCLKQNKVSYNHGKIVNIYCIYRLSPHTSSNTDFTIKDLEQ